MIVNETIKLIVRIIITLTIGLIAIYLNHTLPGIISPELAAWWWR